MAFGADPMSGTQLYCSASSGGTGAPYFLQTKTELMDALDAIFTAARTP